MHSEVFKYYSILYTNLLRKESSFIFTAELVENDDNGYEYDEIGNSFFLFCDNSCYCTFVHSDIYIEYHILDFEYSACYDRLILIILSTKCHITYVMVRPFCTRHTRHPGLVVWDSGYKAATTTYGAYKALQITMAEYGPTDASEYVFVLMHVYTLSPTPL